MSAPQKPADAATEVAAAPASPFTMLTGDAAAPVCDGDSCEIPA